MRKKSRLKIARCFCSNSSFNKTIIRLKRSWDEVESILCKGNKCNLQCDRRHDHKHHCDHDHHVDHDHDHDHDHEHEHHHDYDYQCGHDEHHHSCGCENNND